jgi:hypothetical protein
MECCRGDRRAAVCVQKTRVWFEAREWCTFKVKDFDCVVCSTAIISLAQTEIGEERSWQIVLTQQRLGDAHACLQSARRHWLLEWCVEAYPSEYPKV